MFTFALVITIIIGIVLVHNLVQWVRVPDVVWILNPDHKRGAVAFIRKVILLFVVSLGFTVYFS